MVIDVIVVVEVCGFVFVVLMVIELGIGFVLICKFGKLFYNSYCYEYDFEYGFDVLEIYVDGVE